MCTVEKSLRMANPSKQISHRRLLPFPGGGSAHCGRRQNANGNVDLEAFSIDNVKACLSCHPDLLEDIVMNTVDSNLLKQWLQKKKTKATTHECLQSLKQPLLQEKYATPDVLEVQKRLYAALQTQEDMLPYLYEVANVLGTAIKSDSVAMYVTRSDETDLYLYVPAAEGNKYQLGLSGQVMLNRTVAAHVAKTKKCVIVKDLHSDSRFPNGIGVDGTLTHSVLCVPVTLPSEDLLSIIQFGRNWQNPVFNDPELQLVNAMVGWTGVAIHQNNISGSLQKQSELNDFLLKISRVMFDNVLAMDTLVEKIMTFAKDLVSADRCALFLVDEENRELYANLFDEGFVSNGVPTYSRRDTIRFPVGKGIAGTVAQTGEIVNIKDAYADPRFNREIDRDTGYTTHHILCMPIISKGSVVGVIQMINKVSNNQTEQNIGFNKTDEAAFKMFAVYCALALHYSKIHTELQQCTAELSVAKDKLQYHALAEEADIQALVKAGPLKEMPPDLDSFYFYGPSSHQNQLMNVFLNMVDNLLPPDCFDRNKLCRLLVTVKKNYRPVAYHNWYHGWNVAHCMYCFMLILKDTNFLTDLQMQAMLIASLCHDIDHRGFNNAFYIKFQQPLSVLYPSSVLENHHFTSTLQILQEDDHNIFSHLSSAQYKEVAECMKHTIISTDLALHFPVQRNVAKLVVSRTLDLSNPQHMSDVISLMMTASDLSAVVKSWQDQRAAVFDIYDEFYSQGDTEREMGENVIPMLDRNNAENMPRDQVNFIKLVCLPCYQTIADIIPEASELLSGCSDNLEQWQRVVEGKSTKVWEPAKSRI